MRATRDAALEPDAETYRAVACGSMIDASQVIHAPPVPPIAGAPVHESDEPRLTAS
jgi:hypothetical protein